MVLKVEITYNISILVKIFIFLNFTTMHGPIVETGLKLPKIVPYIVLGGARLKKVIGIPLVA